jgi:Predicted exporters of the RND superfamily
MADEEFATVQDGALENAIGTVITVLVILWLALKSARLIVAVFINLVVGLALTAAFGLMMVGALNMISVAFAVLFVGLGVDFGIQFSVRYRAERHDVPELAPALVQAAEKNRRSAYAGGGGSGSRLSVVPSDRLSGRL